MLIQTRTTIVKKGYADKLIENFAIDRPVDQMEGLIDRTIMVNTRNKEHDEVVVMIRWESKEAWKNWEKSPEHIAGHRNKKDHQPPEYVISGSVAMYEVMGRKLGKAAGNNV
jgi:heme oxygenase (staphylobilin-producing)